METVLAEARGIYCMLYSVTEKPQRDPQLTPVCVCVGYHVTFMWTNKSLRWKQPKLNTSCPTFRHVVQFKMLAP
ncbi:hypothetical protein OUZ56_002785 [Daphnia magna]|uniref:Uncharacterized protein n=1 Tax=Daphnia magna TaxID=35525 RepID=A0ABR0A6S1_9CRUS|nr:hypothetical protein OUZ56_002785 [Daphnia magna]